MPLYPVLLIGVMLLADGGLVPLPDPASVPWSVGLSLGIPAGILAVTWAGVARCHRTLARGQPRALVTAERLTRLARSALVLVFAAAVLWWGWLGTVRRAVGDTVALDEVLAVLPTLAAMAATWWIYHPIERRLREATLLRRLDSGQSLFPIPSRGRYVATQVRTQLLFMLGPVLLILVSAEAIDGLVRRHAGVWWVGWAGDVTTLAAAAGIVVVSPALARLILEVQPIPAGPLRDDLQGVCRRHRVAVRELLVWHTGGSMINAAVMGLFGRLRYVLLTDALLECMSQRQIEAVMAHEIGHIRRHHMPWLLVALVACVFLVTVPLVRMDPGAAPGGTAVVVAAIGAGLALFGWISRRFERQADTFAVRHLDGGPVITAEAVEVVAGALETIARLNATTLRRRSWRHGSIAWRQEYLRSIVGCPGERLAIDAQVRRIKTGAAVVAVAGLAWTGFASAREAPQAATMVPCSTSPRCTVPATTSCASTRSPSPPWPGGPTCPSWPGPCATVASASAATG